MQRIPFTITLHLIMVLLFIGCQNKEETAPIYQINNIKIIKPYKSTSVFENQTILYNHSEIIFEGNPSDVPTQYTPSKTIDGKGQYIMAGMVDGFGTINNQAYADIYLKKGITTIIGVESERRGPFYDKGSPSPDIYKLEGLGDSRLSDAQLLFKIDSLDQIGVEVLLLMYELTPHQTKMAIKEAKSRKMATIGELGFTSYAEAMALGMEAFVHNTRYSLDVAPTSLALSVAKAPFSSDPKSPKWQYYRYLTQLDAQNPKLKAHAQKLGQSNTFIMPTLSLCYLDWANSNNPWQDPMTKHINSKDIHRPADKTTGKHKEDKNYTQPYTDLLNTQLHIIEKAYYTNGAKYLIGSGADVWGTMPGISVYQEMELLQAVGLTNKEILSAASANFNTAFNWPIGKIEKGFKPHFIIMTANPIDNIQNLNTIHTTILNGAKLKFNP